MNICNSCGWQNNHEGFCDRCGNSLPILMKQNMPNNYGYNQYAQPVQKKKTLVVNNIYVIFSYINTFLAAPIISMSLIVSFFVNLVCLEINGVEQLPKILVFSILVLLYIGYMVFDVSSCTKLIKRKNSGRVMTIIKESVKSILNFVVMILFIVNSFSETRFADVELSEAIAEVIIFVIMCFIQISIKIAIILYYIKTKKYFCD